MKLLEFACSMKTQYRNFVISFALELMKDYAEKVANQMHIEDGRPESSNYGTASSFRSKLLKDA